MQLPRTVDCGEGGGMIGELISVGIVPTDTAED